MTTSAQAHRLKTLRLVSRASLISGVFLLLPGCAHTPLYPEASNALKQTERVKILDALNKKNAPRRAPASERAVRVFAQDLQLPETGSNWGQQTYSFYIWAQHPAFPNLSAARLVELGLLRVDFVGGQLNLTRGPVTPASIDPWAAVALGPQYLAGEHVLEYTVKAADIKGPIRLAAWFPTEYRTAAAAQTHLSSDARTTWADARFVKIRAGDLSTRIDIIDQTEARAAFGDEFPRHFFIGRVFMRNNNTERKLVVYTTSMRVPVYLYRRDSQLINRDDPPDDKGVTDAKRDQESRIKTAKSEAKQCAPDAGSSSLGEDLGPWKLWIHSRNDEGMVSGWLLKRRALRQREVELYTGELQQLQRTALRSVDQIKIQLTVEAKNELERLQVEILSGRISAYREKKTQEILSPLMSEGAGALASTLEQFQATSAKLQVAKEEAAALADPDTGLTDEVKARFVAAMIRDGIFKHKGTASPWDDATGIDAGIVDDLSPIVADQPSRTSHRVLLSADTRREDQLNLVGYLWRDQTRPMTFQAVLNSLLLTQNHSTRAKWSKGVNLAGRVAGGLIALGPLVSEFGREGFARAVGFYTSVIGPETADLLLEDLSAHLRNLGEMSMDTVMVLQPRSSVDRYIFFPRGPIYNHPDEIDFNSPAHIVKILGEDVYVQAELVETSVNPAIDGRAASQLVGDALNFGREAAAAQLAKESEARQKVASADLARALGRIEEALIEWTKAEGDALKRKQLETQVRATMLEYRALHKDFGDREFNLLLVRYGLPADGLPPTLDDLPKLIVLRGTATEPRPLPAKDDKTPLEQLVATGTSPVAGLQWTATATSDPKALAYQLTTSADTPVGSYKVKISVIDRDGQETTAEQSVEVVEVALEALIKGAKLPRPEATVLSADGFSTVDVRIPLFDTGESGWTVEVAGENVDVRPKVVPLRLEKDRKAAGTFSISAIDSARGGEITLTLKRNGKEVGKPSTFKFTFQP